MLTLECWWAGHRIKTCDVAPEELDEKLAELKGKLKAGWTHRSGDVEIDVMEICVDIKEKQPDGKTASITFRSFKK